MNIEVKRSIEIDDLLPELKLKAETNPVGKMGKEVVIEKETLQDAIHVIEVLVKKNKQLRDINKNLNEKLERRNKTISDLTNQVGKLNHEIFEMQIPEGKCDCGKNDTRNCCCKDKQGEQHEKAKMVKSEISDMYNGYDMDVMNALAGILLHGLAL